eukprot:NODE_1421_length_927_cov_184.714123_g1097_i0.p1 GENE.NODE_1421_length_927_cov_184.714123_g1097_i0~~NODE_1421_length_927_cov_184.714123_g1097_i0.p1  ORF type:complete len:178 (+),score=38.03 NODE_1421_length_927_cov_184.714123_g1097_i0:310-843(+)
MAKLLSVPEQRRSNENVSASTLSQFRWPLSSGLDAIMRASTAPPPCRPALRLCVIDVSKNRLSAISGFALCSALAGQSLDPHSEIIQSRALAFEELDKVDRFPGWNSLNSSQLMPPPPSEQAAGRSPIHPPPPLSLLHMNLAGNHFGAHGPVIEAFLRERCLCCLADASSTSFDIEP